jgi:ParB-like chromosome segregation protein Spo0J
MNNQKIEHLPVSDLTPYDRNSRTHSDAQIEQIIASIREFGFVNPVLVDGTGRIVAGHGRVMAAKKMALATVPCLRLDGLTEEQIRAYVIADNKLAENAGWDESMLRLEIADLDKLEFDLGFLGFEQEEITEMLSEKKIKIKKVELSAPTLSWVLIGIPLVRFGEISEQIDAIAAIPQTIVQTTVTD